LFFLFTYANLNLIPFADYFGGENVGGRYPVLLVALIIILTLISFVLRKMQIKAAN